jgi:2'-5' RNA ligase
MAEESALAIRVPAAEPIVGKYRTQYDPSAAEGVPAHITVLYPFMPPNKVDEQIETELAELFFAYPAFSFNLNKIQTFPGVLYLAPDPAAPFRTLTEMVVARFSGYPPYGGLFQEIIPHLTVGHAEDPEDFTRLESAFAEDAARHLPVHTTATAVTLIENRSDGWRVRRDFPLGA